MRHTSTSRLARRRRAPTLAVLTPLLGALALACNPPLPMETQTGGDTSGTSETDETSDGTGSSGTPTTIEPTVTGTPATTTETSDTTAGSVTDTTSDTEASVTETSSSTTNPTTEGTTDPGDCGNGVVDGPEQCDSGGVETAECDPDCTLPSCGDGYLNTSAGEVCDPGDDPNDPSGCVGPGTALAQQDTLCQDGQIMFVTASTYQIDAGPDQAANGFYSRDDDDDQRINADERCQEEADAAGLLGSFRAWLSVAVPGGQAIAHVGVPMDSSLLLVGYLGYDANQDVGPETFVFANTWSNSYGIIPVDPDDTAFTRPVLGAYSAPADKTAAWTASTTLGQLDSLMGTASDCGAWKDDSQGPRARIGRPGIPYQWSQSENSPQALGCELAARLFCIEAP